MDKDYSRKIIEIDSLVVSQKPLNGGTMDLRRHRKNISKGMPTRINRRSETARLARK
jgi:hypothetical protein